MSRIELESERDDLKQRIEELDRILASAEALDNVVISEMDEAVATYGTPRRTVLLDEDADGKWKKPMRIIRKEKGIINGKIDYSCFSEIFLNIFDDFQIRSLQEIYKFVFIIF